MSGFGLDGKVALVTGGRQGIGRGIALELAEAGADVAVCDVVTDDGALQSISDEIRGLGRRAFVLRADVSIKADVDTLIDTVENEFGEIDILVNNAGIGCGTPLLEIEEDEWRKVIDIHLNGTYFCCQATARKMTERKRGNIINISSIEGIRTVVPLRMSANPYPSAKAGIISMTRGLAHELGPFNIRVNAIAPGAVNTEMLRPALENQELQQYFKVLIPLGRAAEPGEIGKVAVFLASDSASYVTGITVPVDGGYLA